MSLFSRKKWRLPRLGSPPQDSLLNYFQPVFWGTRDPQSMAESMHSALGDVQPGAHFADNLFTWSRNLSMLDDGEFVRSWTENAENDCDRAIVWRRYILACAAYHCVQLEGDFVECGAYTGVGVKTVVDYLGGTHFPKTFWAYDLFDHTEDMAHHSMPDHGPTLEHRVRTKFEHYRQVKIFKGEIPGVFQGQSPDTIAYLHIDLNQAAAEVATLDTLFDRVVPGGIVILDDYEWSGIYRPQKLAQDPWFEKRTYRVFPLPTGQGIVLKR